MCARKAAAGPSPIRGTIVDNVDTGYKRHEKRNFTRKTQPSVSFQEVRESLRIKGKKNCYCAGVGFSLLLSGTTGNTAKRN